MELLSGGGTHRGSAPSRRAARSRPVPLQRTGGPGKAGSSSVSSMISHTSCRNRGAWRRGASPARRSHNGFVRLAIRLDHLARRAAETNGRSPCRCHRARGSRRRQHDIGISAVSVINCSWTQTKRSERLKPSRTFSDSGHTTAGFVFWISIAVTGGPSPRSGLSPVRTARCATCRGSGARIERVLSLDQRGVER